MHVYQALNKGTIHKRWILFLPLALLVSCNLPASTDEVAADTPTLTQEQAGPVGKERCGDGVCESPENSDLCPQDCPEGEAESVVKESSSTEVTPAGGSFITYVSVEGIGDVAVQVILPMQARYEDGAGVVVEVSTFLTGSGDFYHSLDATPLGLIQVAYLWPGTQSASTGAASEGTYDYGGEIGIAALREVLRYATGAVADRDGHTLAERSAITPLYDNVGLYAFSHPGIAAVNVLALYGDQLQGVAYFVGRENPTTDTLTAVEVGHFDLEEKPIPNPYYSYPEDYSSMQITIPYDQVRWDPLTQEGRYTGRPYFDLNGNGALDGGEYALGSRVPTMYDKRMYSVALVQALRENGALNPGNWPEDLATPEQVADWWPFRSSPARYPDLRTQTPDLHVMLVFALRDHVQPARDKPHIHQAFDGFYHAAGLWTRMNPDQSYVNWLDPRVGELSPDNPANSEPTDWMQITAWSHPNGPPAVKAVALAGVAEMADRQHAGEWGDDLEGLLGGLAKGLRAPE